MTCKRGRACPTPTWHCPNKPSKSTKVVSAGGLDKRFSKVQVANWHHSLHLLSWLQRTLLLQAIPSFPQDWYSFPLPGLPCTSFLLCPLSGKSYAQASLTLNTDFKVRAESAVKQTACRGKREQRLRHPPTQNGQRMDMLGKGETDRVHSFILRKAFSWGRGGK